MDHTQHQEDYENIEPKTEEDLSKQCFVCSNIITGESCPQDEEGDCDKQVKQLNILIDHILHSSSSNERDREREEIQSEILSSFKNGKCSICAECLSRAENLLELHLELEKIQMQILDVLKNLQEYLKSEGVRRDGDDLHTRFRDVLQQRFMSRELSTVSQVHLEGLLRAAGAGNQNDSSVICILPEPEIRSSSDGSTGNDIISESEMTVALGCPSFNSEQVISGDLECFQDALHNPEEDNDLVEEDDEKDIKPILNVTTTMTSPLHDNDEGIDILSQSRTQISVDPVNEGNERRLRSTSIRKRISNKNLQVIISYGDPTRGVEDNSNDHGINDGVNDGDCITGQEDLDKVSLSDTKLRKRPKRGSRNSLWDCDICLKKIPSKEMKSHLQSHAEFEKFYECDLCPSRRIRLCYKQIYGTYKGLVWHYLQVRAQHNVRLPCILCPEENQSTLFRRAELCKHLYEIHHPNHKKLPCKKEGCPDEFYDPITRDAHCHQEHSSTGYTCDQCHLQLKSLPDLTKHQRKCHPKLEKCSSCPKEFKSRSSLLEHEKTHEEGYQPEMVECPHPQCSKMISKQYLNNHLKTVHSEDKVTDGWLTCDLCKARRKSKSSLALHIQRMHAEAGSANGKLYSCSSCPREFRCKTSLRNHAKLEHEDPDLVICPQCPKMCPRHTLNRHIKQVHEKKEGGNLSCQHCPKTFHYAWDLKIHEDSHRTERTFKCPVEGCSYAGRYAKALKNHQRCHNEKKFQCQFCPKVFGVKASLRLHESTHKKPEEREEEKVYTCQYCPKTFSLRKYLKDHEDAHRNERKFPCPEPGCQYAAANKSALIVHKLRHKEKIFKCQFCPLTFATKSRLNTHEHTHSTEKRFQCNLCEEAFNTGDARYRHRKKVHADAVVKKNLAGVGIMNQEEEKIQ